MRLTGNLDLELAERALWKCFLLSGADPSPYTYETRTAAGREAGFREWRKVGSRYLVAVEAVRELRKDYDAG